MSTIVEATVSADEFGLQTAFARFPDAEFRLVRHVAHDDAVMPFLWVDSVDASDLDDALRTDRSVENVRRLGTFDDEYLLAVDWQDQVRSLVVDLVEEGGATVLDAHGRAGTWRLLLLFPDHEAISSVYERCRDDGFDVEFDRICGVQSARHRTGVALTDEQYQAVSRAYEAGYYDVPRQVTQSELADAFGVSHQALSERLRRGHATVVSNVLFRNRAQPGRTITPRPNASADD